LGFVGRVLLSGAAASLTSALAAAIASRIENRHAARPMNAVAHIYDGGAPPARNGRGSRNTAVGITIHTAASLWWAVFFEALPPRLRTGAGAALVSAIAYVVDYHFVHRRFRPGFEAHLSPRSLFAVYATLAGGYALGAVLQRRLDHHQEEDRDERDERGHAQRGPRRVVAPEARG
jgi:hypothetical protein